MFGKRKRAKREMQLWEEGFLEAINFAVFILQNQSKKYGDTASIKDMITLISRDL